MHVSRADMGDMFVSCSHSLIAEYCNDPQAQDSGGLQMGGGSAGST